MTHSSNKHGPTRARREHCFRQADRAWARALALLLQSGAGRRALGAVLSLRCSDTPGSSVWFHTCSAALESAQPVLEVLGDQTLLSARRFAGGLRITCDGISAVLGHLDEAIEPGLMGKVNAQRARGHAWLHRIVLENQSLISYWMRSHGRSNEQDRDDLHQTGLQSLVRASQRFDVERGFQFSTCALQWFRSYVGVQRDNARFQVSASRADLRNLRRIHAVIEAHGRTELSLHQAPWIAEQLDLAAGEVEELINLDRSERSVDADVYTSAPVLESAHDTETGAIAMEQAHLCDSALASLDARSQKVIRMRFGLGCPRPFEVSEIARQLDVTTERVRQLYNAALRALRENRQIQDMSVLEVAQA